jgi:hypothetical protein
MNTTERNPTMVAKCGCPYDPEYDEGHLGWHLAENHPEMEGHMLRTRYPTKEEAELVGREFPNGDEVLLLPFVEEVQRQIVALIFEDAGICDAAHSVPAGVYLEE